MRQFVYFCVPCRATFLEDATEEENEIVEQHFQYLQNLLAKKRLILGGRCQDGPPGIVVFEAESDQAAKEVVDNDPAVKAGIFTAELRPYRVALMRSR